MMVYTPECSSSAFVGWNEPTADDNSGHVIVNYPSIRPLAQLSIGVYFIIYSASDADGNRANCTFVVKVASMSSKYVTLTMPLKNVACFLSLLISVCILLRRILFYKCLCMFRYTYLLSNRKQNCFQVDP